MKRAPLDLQSLLAKKKEAEQQASKPRFLSEKERREQKAALALQRRAQAVENRHKLAKNVIHQESSEKQGEVSRIGRRSEYADHVQDHKKRRITDPKKFTFDWDKADDTSTDANPIYAEKHSALFYGRGKVAGSDASREYTYSQALRDIDPEQALRVHELERQNAEKRTWDDRHWSEKPLSEMRERDWRIFKEDYSIQTKGGSIPNPLRSWSEASFPEKIMEVIESVGYVQPTPIQRATIPIGLQMRDIIGIAETGSGKTASFVLPMLAYISQLPALDDSNRNDGPYAIVLAPTRELAQQIEAETRKFASALDLTVVSIVGGHAIEEQAFALRNGAQILIATPGRLLDCLERHVLVLNQCTYVVMDEADRMVDLGFEEAVNAILDALPVSNMKPDTEEAEKPSRLIEMHGNRAFRQTVMFSATMPPAVEKLTRKYLRRPATVLIGNAGQVVSTVEQRIEVITGDEKRKRRMEELLNSGEFDSPIIVFVNTKRNCDVLAKHLTTIGWEAVILHGGKTQEQRETALNKLRSGSADVLVATDLAGRGIDVPDVSLVLNFDIPKSIEDYVHRIGRTGRAGKRGVAVTFLTEEDEETRKAIQNLMKNQKRPVLS